MGHIRSTVLLVFSSFVDKVWAALESSITATPLDIGVLFRFACLLGLGSYASPFGHY